jgi:ribosomal protein L10
MYTVSTFTMIDINNSKKLRRLLEVPAKANSDEAVDKARRAYAACMDLDKVEELGKMPILVCRWLCILCRILH